MRANRSVPPATIIPVLHYADVRAAVEWLSRAFGFRERLTIGTHRAHSLLVRVHDVDAHCANARARGATVVREPAPHPYGWGGVLHE